MKGKISVIMPAYNEARHIFNNLLEVVETLSSFHYDYEVILVDDGSPDKTYLEAAKLLSTHPELIRVVHYEQNRGKGNALMCGATFAKGDYVVFLDADMDLHPSQLPVLFAIMDSQEADVVIGSKRHRASIVNYPLKRRLYSAAYYSVIRLLFGLPVKDTQTGLKVFRRQVLDRVFPRVLVKRFAFDLEVLVNAHHLGYRIVDAPVTLEFQRGAFDRIKPGDVYRVILDTLAIFYRMHILKYYDSIPQVTREELQAQSSAQEIQTAR